MVDRFSRFKAIYCPLKEWAKANPPLSPLWHASKKYYATEQHKLFSTPLLFHAYLQSTIMIFSLYGQAKKAASECCQVSYLLT